MPPILRRAKESGGLDYSKPPLIDLVKIQFQVY